MSLLIRLILGVVALVAVGLLASATLLQRGLGASYAAIEREAAAREMQRLVDVLDVEAAALGQLLLGWAHWTDLYMYMGQRDARFREENLTPATLGPSDLAWVLIYDAEGRLVDAIAAGADGPPTDLGPLRTAASPLSRVLAAPLRDDAPHCGIAVLADAPFLACRMRIRDTQVQQPPRGIMVLARRFDARLLARVQAASHLAFGLEAQPAAGEPAAAALASVAYGRAVPAISTEDARLVVHQPLHDLTGARFATLRLEVAREISALGQHSLRRAIMQMVAVALLVTVVLVLAVDHFLVRRVRRLESDLESIRQSRDWRQRVGEGGRDELGRLAAHTNALLGVIEAQVRELENQALTDPLTRLPNRRAFEQRQALALRRHHRGGTTLALLMIDIDWFKRFNDLYGHAAGDAALQQLAEALRAATGRATDMPARLGGEEFVALIEDSSAAGALEVAQHLSRLVADLGIRHGGSPFGVLTLSIGVALLMPGEGSGDLFMRADRALYRAKDFGRHRIELDRPEQASGG